MNRVIKLDRATKAGIPNANGITFDKESFDRSINKDRILELISTGSFNVEAAPNGLSVMCDEKRLFTVDPAMVCAKIISIDDEQVEIEVTNEENFALVNDPVVSFTYTAKVEDRHATVENIGKAVLMSRDICYRR